MTEKGKQEQDQKRQLWNEQQKARMKNNLPENRNILGGQDSLGAESSQEKPDKELAQESQDRSPRAVAARLRDFQRKETVSRQKKTLDGQVQGGVDLGQTTKHLKNVYRIINGASAISFFGLIITLFTMNLQLLVGNLLGLKFIPKLSLFEIIIIFFLDLLLIFVTLFLIVFIYAILNPCKMTEAMSEWSVVASFLDIACGVVGKAVGLVKDLF